MMSVIVKSFFDEATKPASLLEASIKVGNVDFKNVLVMNSISKEAQHQVYEVDL